MNLKTPAADPFTTKAHTGDNTKTEASEPLTPDKVDEAVQRGQTHVPEDAVLRVLPEDGGVAGQVGEALQLSQGAHAADGDGEAVAGQQLLHVEGPRDLLQDQPHVAGQRLRAHHQPAQHSPHTY